MAVSANSGQSAVAEYQEIKRTVHSLIDYVNRGVYTDMERLIEIITQLRSEHKKCQIELRNARTEIGKLQLDIYHRTTREVSLKTEYKKLQKEHRNYGYRVQCAMSMLVDDQRLDAMPAGHRQCFRDLSSMTQNISMAIPVGADACIAELQQRQQELSAINDADESLLGDADGSWHFATAAGDNMDADITKSRIEPPGPANLDISKTRSGRNYGPPRLSRTGATTQPVVFPTAGFPLRTGSTHVDQGSDPTPSDQLPPRPVMGRRSKSSEVVPFVPAEQPQQRQGSPAPPRKSQSGILSRRSRSHDTRDQYQPMSQLTRSPSSSLARPHLFVNETTMITKAHTCIVCNKKSRFGNVMMRCQNCNFIVHPACRNGAPSPCWGRTWNSPSGSKLLAGKSMTFTPLAMSPSSAASSGGRVLTSLVNELPPFVPPVVIQCVAEVENRGMTEAGLYRLSGSRAEVRGLAGQLDKGKHPPILTGVQDIHVICSLMKEFLMSLSDPVIPRSNRHEFLNSLDLTSDDKLSHIKSLVKSLPDAHHDTLLFLIIHLQKVAGSPQTQMPIASLARVFGPTLMGPPLSATQMTAQAAMRDTDRCTQVVELLLTIPYTYWRRHLRIESDSLYAKNNRSRVSPAPPAPSLTTTSAPTVTSESENGSGDHQGGRQHESTTNSASGAAGHAVRSFFSRPDSHQPPQPGQVFTKKVNRKK